jgi:polar amino acid transport system ATP-binding protein
MLEATGLTKRLGDRTLFDGVSLRVSAGEAVVVMGPSGSGKTTLLRCLDGLERADAGTVRVGDDAFGPGVADYEQAVARVRRRIGLVFQQWHLFPHLSVLENVILGERRAQGTSRPEAEERGRELLGRFGLAGREADRPDNLSGGQQQRVAIARAFSGRPRALLLDEVTSALDPELVGEVLEAVRDLKLAGMTMVIATHEMSFAREVADEVAFLHDGRIVEQGPPERVLSAPRREETKRFLSRLLEAGRA